MKAGKLDNAKEEMKKNSLNILGIAEMRWVGTGEFQSEEFLVIYSGNSEVGKNGVGFILSKKVKNSVVTVKCACGSIPKYA